MKNYREVVIGPYSAYQIAVKHGFEGTEEDWLKSVERDRLAAEAAAEKAKEYINADATLTISGAPADAKITGQKFDERYTKTEVDREFGNRYTKTEIDDKIASIVSDKTLNVEGGFADSKTVGDIILPRLSINIESGSSLVITDGKVNINGISKNKVYNTILPHDGEWTVTATLGAYTTSEKVYVEYCRVKTLALTYCHIYGASWDGTSTTRWSRTDEAAEFTDPVPYVAGASSYGSPFDNLQPWAGMTVSERTGGTMVAIPKFWYKLEQNGAGMTIRIADKAVEGYSVSPAHMDRGDGHGERDVVYVGRYHCNNNYKSATGMPKTAITRSTARSDIHNLGPSIWQSDFAMRFTIWLLYLVEFADWNSQIKIGYGCGEGSAANMGYTDDMPYHTGTTKSSRTTYGCGMQYRNIEGLWDNVFDWCDGCYYDSNGLNIILNPLKFSDGSYGTAVSTLSSGWPSAFTVKTTGGYQLFIPTAASGNPDTYSCDVWNCGSSSSPCLYIGGYYSYSSNFGLFYIDYSSPSNTSGVIGCRLQELPND